MRISSLSLIISVPFLIAMAVLLPLSLSYEYQYLFPWLIVPVAVLLCLYTFRPQIDYWWRERQKIGLDQPLLDWLNENSIFYNSLGTVDRQKFELRASLFLESKDFALRAKEDHSLPEQYKLLSIHDAIVVTWNYDDYLFSNYDRIIMYPHAFPTPNHKYLHPYELHHEDGVILMSQPHLINGFLKPANFFNVGLYTWANAFILVHPNLKYPQINDSDIDLLDQVFPYTIEQIKELIGEDLINNLALHIVAYFNFAPKYTATYSREYSLLHSIFSVKGN